MLTAAERDIIIAELIDTGNAWDPADTFLGVFTSVDDHGIDTVSGDFTLGAGGMATRVVLGTWGTPHVKSDGRAMVDAPPVEFRPASGAEGGAFAGWLLADAITAGVIKAWGYFATPQIVINETTAFTVVARLTVDPTTGRWDDVVVLNG